MQRKHTRSFVFSGCTTGVFLDDFTSRIVRPFIWMLCELLAPAQHHDKLFLGRVSAVRLIVPEAATCKDAVFHLLLLRQFFYFCSCQSSSFFPMKIALKGGERFLTKIQVVRSLGQARLFQSFSIAVGGCNHYDSGWLGLARP